MNKSTLQRIHKWALKIQEKDTEGKIAQARKIAALANRDSKGVADAENTLKQVTSYQAIYGRFIAEELLRPGAEADTEVEATAPLTGQDISEEQEEWTAAAARLDCYPPSHPSFTRIRESIEQLNPNEFTCMESPLSQVTRLINRLKDDKQEKKQNDYDPIKDPFSDTLWCPYCDSECTPDYCWHCHSELGEKAAKMYGDES